MDGSYDLRLVAASLAIASLASYTALDLAARITAAGARYARWWLLGGALAMGTGIWSMHFVGMMSFRLPITLYYGVPLTVASWVIAVLVSGYALRIVSAAELPWRRLCLGGCLMAVGISAMHYLGMAAIPLSPGIAYEPWPFAASIGIAFVASFAALWLAFSLRAQKSRYAHFAQIGSAVAMGLAIAGMHYTGMAAARFAAGTVCLTQGVNETGLGTLVTVFSVCMLLITLTTSYFDHRLQRDTGHLRVSLKRARSELEFLVTHDSLTRLPNRLLFGDRLEHAVGLAQERGMQCAALFFDLDRFKSINDSLGHGAGDELLCQVAARAQSILRTGDTVARLGGDEFAVVLPHIEQASAAGTLAGRLQTELAKPYTLRDEAVYVSASIGIALYPDDAKDPDTLIAHADAAMYHAKRAGRDNYQFFLPEMNAFDRTRVELEAALRAALVQEQFELHYQPKANVRTGAITSIEALIRWRHPERGLIPPADFIPVAEETGLIVAIGRWVLHEACRQNRAWQDAGLPHMRVAVNLSATQFRDPHLPKTVAAALTEAGLSPNYLEVELTESVIMTNAEQTAAILNELSELGVHISIDDFGTGYSSLAYLKSFPLDKLKIDRMFVRDLASDTEDLAIVRAIVSLAHSLKLKVIAEGVETPDQLCVLRTVMCDEYQGYLCAKPLPAEDLANVLRARAAA